MRMGNYATNIAIVKNGVVTNIIWGMIYQLSEFTHDNQIAVQVDHKGVRVGDTYVNGEFYDADGNVVLTDVERYDGMIEELDNYIIESAYDWIIEDIEEE